MIRANFGVDGIANISYFWSNNTLSTKKEFLVALKDECTDPNGFNLNFYSFYRPTYVKHYNQIMKWVVEIENL